MAAMSLIGILRRQAWHFAAGAAVLLLLALALYSPDRQKGLAEFQAAGPMRHIQTAEIVTLRIAAGERHWGLERRADGWQRVQGGALLDTGAGSAIEAGLRLLHNTPPERSFVAESPDFGLTPPVLSVRLATSGGASFEVEFGHMNPMGLARYVRIRDRAESALHLMPSYVAEPWEQVSGKLGQ